LAIRGVNPAQIRAYETNQAKKARQEGEQAEEDEYEENESESDNDSDDTDHDTEADDDLLKQLYK